MKDKIMCFTFLFLLFFLMIASFLFPDREVSISERRTLTKFPTFNLTEVWEGNYFEKLNRYLVDHFPFREEFRKLKGVVASNFLQQKENDGVFIQDNAIYQLEEKINQDSILYFTNLLTGLEEKYFQNASVYYALIPDKNYYLADSAIPKLDYSEFFARVRSNLPSRFQEINLTNDLSLDSYYRTDIHWKQECLRPVVDTFSKQMNFEIRHYPQTAKTFSNFYGALYGRIASPILPDTLTYFTSPLLEEATVYNYEKNKEEKVYEEENLHHIDSYDIYLSGATPLLILYHPHPTEERELVLFRDSFGSSIAPLFLEAYSKITVIDLRYFRSSLIDYTNEIVFSSSNLDVLFLYSIPIANNSFTLK